MNTSTVNHNDFYQHGVALSRMGKTQEALDAYAQSLAMLEQLILIAPQDAKLHNFRATVLQKLGRLEEALAGFVHTIALNPDYANFHINHGFVLQSLKRYKEAIASYDKAIALVPKAPTAYFHKAIVLLLQGNFAEGWPMLEWRKKLQGFQPAQTSSLEWDGVESLAGKKIIVYGEQGIGDAIQFSRYAGLLAERGAQVTLLVNESLVPLVKRVKGVKHAVPYGTFLAGYDYYCWMMSLPLLFNGAIPAAPYMQPHEDQKLHWKEKLGPKNKIRVGLVWQGNPQHVNNANRNIAFMAFMPFLDQPNMKFYSLQKEMNTADNEMLSTWGVPDLGKDVNDFADTAAVVDALDLVITVDTAVAHLAGAMGKPVWILLPFAPDFRWLAEGEDTAWYPSARIFRQKQRGNWEGVIGEVTEALKTLAG